jgi:hypothetical protein
MPKSFLSNSLSQTNHQARSPWNKYLVVTRDTDKWGNFVSLVWQPPPPPPQKNFFFNIDFYRSQSGFHTPLPSMTMPLKKKFPFASLWKRLDILWTKAASIIYRGWPGFEQIPFPARTSSTASPASTHPTSLWSPWTLRRTLSKVSTTFVNAIQWAQPH